MAKKTSGTKQTVSKAAEQTAAKPARAAELKNAAKPEATPTPSAAAKAAPISKAQEQTSATPARTEERAETAGARTQATPVRPPVDPRGNKAVTQEQIAQRAFEIYRARNGRQGDAMNDWLQAEQELRGGRQ